MSEDDATLAPPPVPTQAGPGPASESLSPADKELSGVDVLANKLVPASTPMADAAPEDGYFFLPRTQAATPPALGLASGSSVASAATPTPLSGQHASRSPSPSAVSPTGPPAPLSPMPLSPGRKPSPLLETTASSAIYSLPPSLPPPSPSVSPLTSPTVNPKPQSTGAPAPQIPPPPMERRPTVRFDDTPKLSALDKAAAAAGAVVETPAISMATATEALRRTGPRIATVEDDSSASTSASSTPKPTMETATLNRPAQYPPATTTKRMRPTTAATKSTAQQPAATPRPPTASDTRRAPSELTAVDRQWGVLFANGKPTKRFDEVMESLARFMIEEFLPPSSIVIGPKKLASFYTFHHQDDDPIAHGAMLNSQDKEFHRKLGDLFEEFGCQYHLVPADDRPAARPRVPALTPRGFTRWMQLHIIAFPDEEARRLAHVISNFPLEAKSALDGRSERLPKQISRYLLPTTPDYEIRNLLRQAVKRHFGESYLATSPPLPPVSPPPPSPLPALLSGPTRSSNDATAGLRPDLSRRSSISSPPSGSSRHGTESFRSSSRAPPPLDSKNRISPLSPIGRDKRAELQELNYRRASCSTPPSVTAQHGGERRPPIRADERSWDVEPGLLLSPTTSASSASGHPNSGYYSDNHHNYRNSSTSDKSRHSQSRPRRTSQSTASTFTASSPIGGDRNSNDNRYPPPSPSAATRSSRGSSVKNLFFSAIGAGTAANVGASSAAAAGMGAGGGAGAGTAAALGTPARSFSNTSARRTARSRGEDERENRDRRGESRDMRDYRDLSQESRESRDRLDRRDSRDRQDLREHRDYRDHRASYPPGDKHTTRGVRSESGSGAATVQSTNPLATPNALASNSSGGRQPASTGRRPSFLSSPTRMSMDSVHGSSMSSLATAPIRPSPLQAMEPVDTWSPGLDPDRDRGRDHSRYRHHSHDSADPVPSTARRDRDHNGGGRQRRGKEGSNRYRERDGDRDRDRDPNRDRGREQDPDRDSNRDRDRDRDGRVWQARRSNSDGQAGALPSHPHPLASSLQSLSSSASVPASPVPRPQRPRSSMLPPIIVQVQDAATAAAAATAPRRPSFAMSGSAMADGTATGSPPPAVSSPHLWPVAAAPRYDSDSSARSVSSHQKSASAGNNSSHYRPVPRRSSLSVATMGRTASSPHDETDEPGGGREGGQTWDDYLQLRSRDRKSSLR